ncbi:unnamed protein product, partial [Phaeothamnion confervicola]
PFPFEFSDDLYLVPETSAEGGVHLYRCVSFPDRWDRVRTILHGIDAADTVIFKHCERWWLITSIRKSQGSSGRYLAIFFTDHPIVGNWIAHPINEAKLYEEWPNGSGRNAGAPIRASDRLLRPSQQNPNYYGERVRWMEIVELSETGFEEIALEDFHPLAQFTKQWPMHHMSIHGKVVTWDVRDRLPRGAER